MRNAHVFIFHGTHEMKIITQIETFNGHAKDFQIGYVYTFMFPTNYVTAFSCQFISIRINESQSPQCAGIGRSSGKSAEIKPTKFD